MLKSPLRSLLVDEQIAGGGAIHRKAHRPCVADEGAVCETSNERSMDVSVNHYVCAALIRSEFRCRSIRHWPLERRIRRSVDEQQRSFPRVPERKIEEPERVVLVDPVGVGKPFELEPVLLFGESLGIPGNPNVGVTSNRRPPRVADARDALRGPRAPPCDIASAPDFIDGLGLDVGYHCVQRHQIPVDVGDNRQSQPRSSRKRSYDLFMVTLADRIRRASNLDAEQSEHLRRLCSTWQVLADLSFSDLLLFVPVPPDGGSADVFEIFAQLRPFTSQTLYPQDMVGTRVTQPEQPMVERAFREGRIWAQNEPVLVDGLPIRMDAVPVRFNGDVIAVVTKEGSPGTWRRPGRLEEVYLDAAEHVSLMICNGEFPYTDVPTGDWPRVGDGLFVLDGRGIVTWASPNALSSLRRLGVQYNVLGHFLDGLGFGETPVAESLVSGRIFDGELARGDTSVQLRVLPLVEGSRRMGALVLARDVTELRQKDRMLSLKDATIREIHHRVKNNLQTIASLLRLQGRRLESEEAKTALRESVLRIGSIALVHETLSEAPSDVADFAEVARRIAHMVAEGLVFPERRIDLRVTGATGPVAAEVATPLAVVLTELLQNSIEHAFVDTDHGSISVDLARNDSNDVRVIVRDDGVGLNTPAYSGPRLGLHIVRTLVGELNGTFDLASNDGTYAEIHIPAERA
jgi:two-component sensor histidine kinase